VLGGGGGGHLFADFHFHGGWNLIPAKSEDECNSLNSTLVYCPCYHFLFYIIMNCTKTWCVLFNPALKTDRNEIVPFWCGVNISIIIWKRKGGNTFMWKLWGCSRPSNLNLKKKNIFCRHEDMNSFMWFTLQSKLATEIGWWPVHWNAVK